MRKIIVVGNGPSINIINAGKWIDAHEQVYRINEFYCTDVKTTGFKITTWATCKDFHRHDIYKTATNNFTVCWSQWPSVLYTNQPGTDRIKLVIERSFDNNAIFSIIPTELRILIAERYRAIKTPTNEKRNTESPSTGLKVLAYLTEFLEYKIDAVGFDGLQFNQKMHYFEDQIKTYRHDHRHWPDRETACLDIWRKNKMINFYKEEI